MRLALCLSNPEQQLKKMILILCKKFKVEGRRYKMSTEKLVEKLGHQISRRSFLTKLGAGTVTTLLALIGFPNVASAACIPYKCCCMCYTPTSSCPSSNCPSQTSGGQWCWNCYYAAEDQLYRCCECKVANSPCAEDCYGVYRSWAYPIGAAP